MFVETRYFDDGKVLAKIHLDKVAVADTNEYDAYLTEYGTIEEFVKELAITIYEIDLLVDDLSSCDWVNITDWV